MTLSTVHIQGISQISIPVHDIEIASLFYNKTLGLPLLFSQSNMALLDCHGIRLLLSIPEKPEFDHPSSTLYFKVADIEDTFRSLQNEKVDFIGKPHIVAEFNGYAVWMAFFRDPDNNVHALTSEVPL